MIASILAAFGSNTLAAASLAAVLAGLAGCTVIPLNVPAPSLAPPQGNLSSELVVFVEFGDYRDQRTLQGFSVLVDDAARAWVQHLGEHTVVRVEPGMHKVTLAHPWRQFSLLLLLPVPESGTVESTASIRCSEAKPCAIAFWPVIDHQRGLSFLSSELSASELRERLPDRRRDQ